MQYIVEYKNFYKVGDIILLEYWYNGMIVPAKIIENISKSRFKVSHNVDASSIRNAPDEVIKSSDILDMHKPI